MVALSPERAKRNALAVKNLGLPVWFVSRYHRGDLESEDLIADARIALLGTAEVYNAELGKFSTLFFASARNRLTQSLQSRRRWHRLSFTLDTLDETGTPVIETIADENADSSQLAEENEIRMKTRMALRKLIKNMSPRARRCLILRFGLNGNEVLSVNEIAAALGITGQGVRDILKRAFNRLQRSPELRTLHENN